MLAHTPLYTANLLKITQFKITSIGKNTQRQDVLSIIDQSFKQIFTTKLKVATTDGPVVIPYT